MFASEERNPLAAEGQTLLQVSPLCFLVKRGILWQQKDKNSSPGQSSLFVNEERNPLAAEKQTLLQVSSLCYAERNPLAAEGQTLL